MPSTATITAFFTAVANQKARATDVNTAFGNFRGHFIPINTDTVSASDLTHDLGSSDHRWRVGYFGSLDLEGSTNTTALQIVPNTASTSGCFSIQAGTTTAKFFNFHSLGADILIAGQTLLSISLANGIATNTVQKFSLNSGVTLSGASGLGTSTTTAQDMTGMTITLNANSVNSYIHIFIQSAGNTTSSQTIRTTSAQSGGGTAYLLRGSTTLATYTLVATYSTAAGSVIIDYPPSVIQHFDNPGTSGSVTYKIQTVVNTTTVSLLFNNLKLGARIV